MKVLIGVVLVLGFIGCLVWEYVDWQRRRRQKKVVSRSVASPAGPEKERVVRFPAYEVVIGMRNEGVLADNGKIVGALQGKQLKGRWWQTKYFAETGEHILSQAPYARRIWLTDESDFPIVREAIGAIDGVVEVRKGNGLWKKTLAEIRADEEVRKAIEENPTLWSVCHHN